MTEQSPAAEAPKVNGATPPPQPLTPDQQLENYMLPIINAMLIGCLNTIPPPPFGPPAEKRLIAA